MARIRAHKMAEMLNQQAQIEAVNRTMVIELHGNVFKFEYNGCPGKRKLRTKRCV